MKAIRYYPVCLLLLIAFFLTTSNLNAQQGGNANNSPPISERIFFGGNLSMQFGDYTYVDVSPIVGIWLLPRLAVAVGPSYKYIKDPLGSTDAYGGKGFARLILIQDLDKLLPLGLRMSLYAHGEYENMSYQSNYFFNNYERERFFQDYLLLGFGLSQYFGLRSSVNITILWVVNESEIQIYESPEFRVGFTF